MALRRQSARCGGGGDVRRPVDVGANGLGSRAQVRLGGGRAIQADGPRSTPLPVISAIRKSRRTAAEGPRRAGPPNARIEPGGTIESGRPAGRARGGARGGRQEGQVTPAQPGPGERGRSGVAELARTAPVTRGLSPPRATGTAGPARKGPSGSEASGSRCQDDAPLLLDRCLFTARCSVESPG